MKTLKKKLQKSKRHNSKGGRKIKCRKGIPCPKKKPLICLPKDKSKICHLDNIFNKAEINKIIKKIMSKKPSNYSNLFNNTNIECNQSSDCGYNQICEAGICQDIEDRKQVLSYGYI